LILAREEVGDMQGATDFASSQAIADILIFFSCTVLYGSFEFSPLFIERIAYRGGRRVGFFLSFLSSGLALSVSSL